MHILDVKRELAEEVVIEKTDHLTRSAADGIKQAEFRL